MATVIDAFGSVLCAIVGEACGAACTGAWGSPRGRMLWGSGVVDGTMLNSLPSRNTPSYRKSSSHRFRFCTPWRHGAFSYFGRTLMMLSRIVLPSSFS